jgi:ubiquinone/menaquinone biosynthesis C-methylase UbiE
MAIDEQTLNDFVGRVFGDLSSGYGLIMMNLGNKLGLYKAMAGAGPLSSQELAKRAGCAERYVREWLNSQAASSYVLYHPKSCTYELTAEQATVLADDRSPVFIPGALPIVAALWAEEEQALNAIRTGEGVPWGSHDERVYCGVAAFYRNAYQGSLVSTWLPALDGVVDKLKAGARVADVGCGHGHSTVLMAQAFPQSKFFGFDVHQDSIMVAKEVAEAAGVSDRVSFEVADATGYPQDDYDLICFFDCLHDMGRPVDAVSHAAKALKKDGTVMLIEPSAGDNVQDNINPVSRLYYTGSTLLCCAHAISENGTHVLGAQAGPRQLSNVLEKGGFRHFRQAMQTPFNMIVEARL